MRVPLVDGQGNFGSVDGDSARRLPLHRGQARPPIADRLMAELRQQHGRPMRPNYDNTPRRAGRPAGPVSQPAVNGASGIAVGMATNIPPHNLGEVVRACIHPDRQPRGHHRPAARQASRGPTSRSAARSSPIAPRCARSTRKAPAASRCRPNGSSRRPASKQQIVITSIPYGVEQGQAGRRHRRRSSPTASCRSCSDLTNESNEKDGLRIALEIKPAPTRTWSWRTSTSTRRCRRTSPYNLTCLVPGAGRPSCSRERLGLKAILRHFLDFRFATVRRRFEYELEQLRKRIHILEGFRIIFNALDKAIKLIRESEGKADAAEKLIKAFKLDESRPTPSSTPSSTRSPRWRSRRSSTS